MQRIINQRWTNDEVGAVKHVLSPPVKYFYWPLQGGIPLLRICLVFVMRSQLFIAAMWSPAGKGLTSWLLFVIFNCVFVTFPCGILGQVWYLIVSIPDLCRLSYFYKEERERERGVCRLCCSHQVNTQNNVHLAVLVQKNQEFDYQIRKRQLHRQNIT